ncbi:similar to alternative sulfate transporter [Aspergillus luchuensis IFO 4308]|nr:similar to alternative sulfate transporter [Aspergillus luchuensis IFO 4308]
MLQKEFQTRQVTPGFDIQALFSSPPLLNGDHPCREKVKRAAELLKCQIVGDEKASYLLPEDQKPSLGPMLDSEPRISSYIQACFETPCAGVNMFLTMASAQECVDAVLMSDCSDRATVVVAYAVLALGCYLGILIMIIFADKCGHHTKSRLITLGVQFVQDLALHSSRRLRQLCTESDERLLKNAFWHLYAIEKADAVDRGRSSMMCDKLTDYSPSDGFQNPDEARLTLQCLYGHICDRRPSFLQEHMESETHLSSYFITFLIHGKWLQLAQQGLAPEEREAYERSEARCLAAARSVLEQCSQHTHVQMLSSIADFRVLPLLTIGFATYQIDRTNIASALTGGFASDIGISQDIINLGNQLMFLGVIVLEIPSNMVLQKVGPRRWISAQVCIFGVIAALQIFIRNKTGFLLTRSILGLAEAGYIPAAMYTLSTWYTKEELTKRIALFFFGMFGGAAVSPLLGAALLKLDGKGGLHGWQWIFLLEGIWSVIMAIALFTLLPEREGNASETSDEESACKSQSWNGTTSNTIPVKVVWETLTNYTKWPHFLATACVFATWSPLTTYTPTIIMSLGFSRIQANALAAIGSLLTLPVIVFFASLSDWSRRRGMSVMLAIAVYLVALILLRVLQAHVDRWGRLIALVPGREVLVWRCVLVMSATAGLMAGTQIFRHDDGLNG